jgi:hypothetical protein
MYHISVYVLHVLAYRKTRFVTPHVQTISQLLKCDKNLHFESTEVEQPSVGHEKEGIGESEESVWISGCGVWTDTERGDG